MVTSENKNIGKEELLDGYIRYSVHRGDARVILKQRLDAILSAKVTIVATIAMWMVDSDSGFNYMLKSICGTIPSIIF